MRDIIKNIPYILLFVLIFSSCMKESWTDEEYLFENTGLYIINSGNFGSSTSSLSYYDIKNNTVYNNIISTTNNVEKWGDVAQSMKIRDGIAYLVLNNSGKILLLDSNTGKIIGKITELESPRYIHFINDEKAYVTDLYARAINIINPSGVQSYNSADSSNLTSDNTVHIGSISTNNNKKYAQHSTEKMVQWGHSIFVACWMRDDKILVIDSNSDKIQDSITVAAQPNSLVIDKYNKLWVLCDGGYDWGDGSNPYYGNPKLFRINPSTLTLEDSITFPIDANPQELCINGSKDTLYFLNTDLYRLPVLSLRPEKHIENNSEYKGYGKGFYGLGIDPTNSDIYISDAIDNAQPGYVYRFNAQGQGIDTFKVGVNPVGFCFK